MKFNLLWLLGLVLLLTPPVLAQGLQKNTIYKGQFQSLNQENIDLITFFQFNGDFAVHLVTDDKSNYFLLNLSLLNGEFENKYFVNEVFKNNLFIQYGHGMPANKAWVIIDSKSLPENGIAMLTNLLANVKSVAATMSVSDKNQWLLSQIK